MFKVITGSVPCEGMDVEVFFNLTPRNIETAKSACADCTQAVTCLTNALDAEDGEPKSNRFGIFGGMLPEQRFKIDQASR
jgi:hypothetical protein